jgi:hypothetical protein
VLTAARVGEKARVVETNNPSVKMGNFIVVMRDRLVSQEVAPCFVFSHCGSVVFVVNHHHHLSHLQ